MLAFMKKAFLFLCWGWTGVLSALEVNVAAKGAVLMNTETGKVLFEKNAHQPLYPASVTKVITALYALEKKGAFLDEEVQASAEALQILSPAVRRNPEHGHPPYRLEAGGTHMSLRIGEILPLKALLYGLMLESGNDAANVIAQYVSGSIGQFMEELNLFVQGLGCQHTQLRTPHGLPCAQHLTTAYDLALLTRRALQHSFFREVVKTVQYTRPATNKQPSFELFQRNALIRSGQFYYPKAIGVKTGYTQTAGYTLVAAAEDAHRKLIAVLLGYENIQQRYKDAIALFEAAFNEPKKERTLFSSHFDRFTARIEGGRSPIAARIPTDLVLTYYPSEDPSVRSSYHWYALPLPIVEGQEVGRIDIVNESGILLLSTPLIAIERVEPTMTYQLKRWGAFCAAQLHEYRAWIMGGIGMLVIGGVGYFFLFHRQKHLNMQQGLNANRRK